MKILFLTFYFHPDLCACSFRATPLAEVLSSDPRVSRLDVFTTMPNRYSNYSVEALKTEQRNRMTIHRVVLPHHKSGMLDQSKAFIHYWKAAWKFIKDSEYDIVVSTSSRLMTGFLGAKISKKFGCPFYLDIRDLFSETITELLPFPVNRILWPILSSIEKYTVRNSGHLNVVSEGFTPYFRINYNREPDSTHTNGIDDIFSDSFQNNESKSLGDGEKINILYAGNIGEGQALHTIIPHLAEKLGNKFHFTIVGNGGRLELLKNSIATSKLGNVTLVGPVTRENLLEYYRTAHILFLHLGDIKAFERVLPSKIFEYAATGLPILAGVAGYAKQFLNSEVENSRTFKPGDSNDAFGQIKELNLDFTNRGDFIIKYSRSVISRQMSDNIINLCDK